MSKTSNENLTNDLEHLIIKTGGAFYDGPAKGEITWQERKQIIKAIYKIGKQTGFRVKQLSRTELVLQCASPEAVEVANELKEKYDNLFAVMDSGAAFRTSIIVRVNF